MGKEFIAKISVVMSVYNAEKYLSEAIESILNQTFKDFEFIIVNDGSTDASLKIIQSYNDERIKLINQKNTGLAKALNNGIKLAKGKYIARMDADDISFPNRLKLQYEFLEQHPDCVAVGGNAEIIDKDGNYVYTSNQALSWEEIKENLPHTPFYHSTTMYRRKAIVNAGYYFEEISKLYSFEDAILWNKLAILGQLRNLSLPLIKYRLVPNAATTKSPNNKIVNKILLNIIMTDKIKEEEKNKLLEVKNQRNNKRDLAIYHLHLAKKYLWNNYQPKLARKNLIISLKNKFNKLSVFYYFVSFLPGKVIQKLYKKLK